MLLSASSSFTSNKSSLFRFLLVRCFNPVLFLYKQIDFHNHVDARYEEKPWHPFGGEENHSITAIRKIFVATKKITPRWSFRKYVADNIAHPCREENRTWDFFWELKAANFGNLGPQRKSHFWFFSENWKLTILENSRRKETSRDFFWKYEATTLTPAYHEENYTSAEYFMYPLSSSWQLGTVTCFVAKGCQGLRRGT